LQQEKVLNTLLKQKKVHVRGPGTYAQYIVTTSENIFHILQDDLSLEEAASHFVNPCIVHYMGYLAEKGGHKVAIHTVGSSSM